MFVKSTVLVLGMLFKPSLIFVGFARRMEQRTLKNVNNYLNTSIYSYLETSGGESSNLYLNVMHFSIPVLIRLLFSCIGV